MSYKEIEIIKNIEKKSYPQFMWQYDEAESLDDIYAIVNKDKKEGKLFCHVEESWYLVGVDRKDEIAISDLASTKNLGFSEMNLMLSFIKKLGNKKVIADCRDLTSYNLLKLLEQRGTIKIISESPWIWGNEKMYELTFSIKPKGFSDWLRYTESKNE